ncbi:hypothetical protein HF086_011672 [Spodoptera exigua]|uniref:EF-hand domain-containing protein n=1 Tax=Spodoptera exigua TaxID=7107 RepID=A0A922MSC3_SPOEX|nr:hypothetical protein HF086_011672 [Spodoptera exigua]
MDNETTAENTGTAEEVKASENHEKESDRASTVGETVTNEGDQMEGMIGTEGDLPEGETGEALVAEEGDEKHIEQEEGIEGEDVEGETTVPEGEHIEGEHVEGEEQEKGENVEGEEALGEALDGEELEKVEEGLVPEEHVEEEEQYVEEPPPDPAAPFDFSDSKEAIKAPYELRPDQLAEVEKLWELFQNHTPAYAELDGFITEKELVYMLKSLMIMTYTSEQLQELVAFCCRPPHPEGHIIYEQFLKMVTIRQRDFPIEEEIRSALQVFDPDRTGLVEREYLKEVLSKQGNKMSARNLDNLIKEVDMSNDGTIGIEDIVATMCIDLNEEDMQMLRATAYPERRVEPQQDTGLADEGGNED